MKNSAETRSDFARQRRLAGYAKLPTSIVDSHGVPMALANDVWLFNVAERDLTFNWVSVSKNPWLAYATKRYCIRQLQRVCPAGMALLNSATMRSRAKRTLRSPAMLPARL